MSEIDFLKLAKGEANAASSLPSNTPSQVFLDRVELANMYTQIAQAEQLKRIADQLERFGSGADAVATARQ